MENKQTTGTAIFNITFAQKPALVPFQSEEYSYESVDYSKAPEWMKVFIEESCEDKRAFDAEFVGSDVCETVHVRSDIDDDGELQMCVLTPLGQANITKAQAMKFFGLVEA